VKKADESASDEDSDEEDTFELLPKEKLAEIKKNSMSRISVSAEVYGEYNKKENYVPKMIKKTAEQRSRIKLRLSQSFMFSALDDKEQEIVIDAMEEKQFEHGAFVIQQGETGDHLYVVDSGSLDCFTKQVKTQNLRKLKNMFLENLLES